MYTLLLALYLAGVCISTSLVISKVDYFYESQYKFKHFLMMFMSWFGIIWLVFENDGK